MSKIYATLKRDSKLNAEDIIVSFFRDSYKRKIDIEGGIVKLEVEYDTQMDTSIIKAIASGDIITLHYNGFDEPDEESAENSSISETVPKTEQNIDAECEQLKLLDVDNGVISTEEPARNFNIEEFSELEDIIRNAGTEENLAKEISDFFFDSSDNAVKAKFKKMFITSLTLFKLSWKELDSKMDEKVTKYEKRRYSKHINGILKKYGYKPANTIDVISEVVNYYRHCHTNFKLPCMQGVDDFEECMKKMNWRLGDTEKLTYILDFICDTTESVRLPKDLIAKALLEIYDIIEKKEEKELSLPVNTDITAVVNRFLRKYDKSDTTARQFLTELKDIGIFKF